MDTKTKRLVVKTLDIVLPICVLLILISSYYIFFIADDNFCVRAEGLTVDPQDAEPQCFRSWFDANNYSRYLLEKYEPEPTKLTLNDPSYNFTLITN